MEISDKELLKKIVGEVIRNLDAKEVSSVNNLHDVNDKFELREIGPAKRGIQRDEVVIGISPAYGRRLTKTITGIDVMAVLREIMAGIEEEGVKPRIVRVLKTADCAFIGHEAAKLSGSGVGIGLQTRGTAVIHQRDLLPLSNLELFPQAPVMTLQVFRAIGKNAAKYAKGETPQPVPTLQDPMSRPRYQAKSAIMHMEEVKYVQEETPSMELELRKKEAV